MRTFHTIQSALVALTLITTVRAGHSHSQLSGRSSRLVTRHGLVARSHKPSCVVDCTTEVSENDIDYIIVGGGTAGLAIASRLSEDESVKVLVIEAGPSGYEDDTKLLVPNGAYYDSALNTKYDWNFTSTAQAGLDGRKARLPRGRALGGSSAINGLYYVRHGMREGAALGHIAQEMTESSEVSVGWDWDDMNIAMNAAVKLSGQPGLPLLADSIAGVNNSLAGTDGPIELGFSDTSFAVQGAWSPAFMELGVARANGSFDGNNLGAFIAPITIDTKTRQRSFSRSAYLDSLAKSRSNLQVLTGHLVTRIHTRQPSGMGAGTQLMAVGVECAKSPTARRVSFKAKREVILTAGAIGSPQILQLSGVGQACVLEKHDINVVKDLPGVGHHLQDHLSTSISYTPKQGISLQNASTTSYTDSAIAYLGLDDLLGSAKDANNFLNRARRLTQSYISNASDEVPESVRMGWNRTMTMLLTDLLSPESVSGFSGSAKGAMEILLSTMNNQISIEQALQAPFSRGSVRIASSNAFDAPQIDTAYLSHPADMELLLAGHSISRKLAASEAMKPFIKQETEAALNISMRAQTERWVRRNANTEFHLSSSCSMLPEAEGGVVGPDLRVHGFSNMRVADASVLAISPTSHLMSYVYGIAEMAAEKIRADWAAEEVDEDCNDGDDDAAKEEGEGGGDVAFPASFDGAASLRPSQGSQNSTQPPSDINGSEDCSENEDAEIESPSFSGPVRAPSKPTSGSTAKKSTGKPKKTKNQVGHNGSSQSDSSIDIGGSIQSKGGRKGRIDLDASINGSGSDSVKAIDHDKLEQQRKIRRPAAKSSAGVSVGASVDGGSRSNSGLKVNLDASSDIEPCGGRADCDARGKTGFSSSVQVDGLKDAGASSPSTLSGGVVGKLSGMGIGIGGILDSVQSLMDEVVSDDGLMSIEGSASASGSGSGSGSGSSDSISGSGSGAASGSLNVPLSVLGSVLK